MSVSCGITAGISLKPVILSRSSRPCVRGNASAAKADNRQGARSCQVHGVGFARSLFLEACVLCAVQPASLRMRALLVALNRTAGQERPFRVCTAQTRSGKPFVRAVRAAFGRGWVCCGWRRAYRRDDFAAPLPGFVVRSGNRLRTTPFVYLVSCAGRIPGRTVSRFSGPAYVWSCGAALLDAGLAVCFFYGYLL